MPSVRVRVDRDHLPKTKHFLSTLLENPEVSNLIICPRFPMMATQPVTSPDVRERSVAGVWFLA